MIAMKRLGKTAAFWAATLLIWELFFHVFVYGGLSPRFLSAIGFTLAWAALLTLLSHLWRSRLANQITRFVLLAFLLLVFSVQTVYFYIFGSMLSLSYVTMGGEAIGNFTGIVFDALLHCAPYLLFYLLAFAVLAVLTHFRVIDSERANLKSWLLTAVCGALVFALSVPWDAKSDRGAVYHDSTAIADRQAEWFGLLTAERLEAARLIGGAADLTGQTLDLTRGGASERNVLPEIDFDALARAADTEARQSLSRYFSHLAGTGKNKYTGMFRGYNLIQICAESYSPYLVDPELTPTLYKLTHEGFVFENFYNSFPSVTTNGEYSLCMGLMPDMGRTGFVSSVYNYLPFCLGNAFHDTAAVTLAYHNNIANFYSRDRSHPNMGYDFRAIGTGLDMEGGHPSSDLELMEKSVDDYIGREPFVVHYMTYSGHCPYSFEDNEMSAKNRDRVAGLNCSEELKAFYACQLELEDAMTYLLQRLEEAGIADRTVIVLTGDHYPYGLSEENYETLAGDAAGDPFWKFRGSFVCWSGGMEEPVRVSEYCCGQDILPTLLNLFGVAYDSRLLTGTDVLSDSLHLALLYDGSYLTKDLIYDNGSGSVTYLTPEADLPEGYAAKLTAAAKNLFAVSRNILYSDYYGFAFSASGLISPDGQQTGRGDSFADIAGAWYRDAVNELTYQGILSGDGLGNYLGGDDTDRAMFLHMLVASTSLPAHDEIPPYTDLDPVRDWRTQAFSAAWAAGLLREGDTCRPSAPLMRDDALEFLVPFAEYAGIPDPENWSRDAYDRVTEEARRNGEDTEPLSRGAAAVLVYRFVQAMDQYGSP